MFRQILVGLDGSEKAKKAARVGFDLARYYSGSVTLIHVPHNPALEIVTGDAPNYDAEANGLSFDEIEEGGQKILDDGLAIAADMLLDNVRTYMPHGEPADEILQHAEEIGADLIITGRRGLSAMSSLVLGNTTQQINHRATCACLSVV